MSSRNLVLLVLAAAAAVLLSWVAQRDAPAPGTGGAALLPEERLAAITALTLQPGGEEPFRIERGDDGWIVPDQHGYPADVGELTRFVRRLADAEVVEEKTSKPEGYASLGVEDVGPESGTGTAVGFEGAADLPALIIGKREVRGGAGTYVRRSGEAQALLVDQDLSPPESPLDWLDRQILDVPVDAVESLTITQPGGESLTIARDPQGQFAVQDVPEGREVAGPTTADAASRALTSLRLEAVRPAADWSPDSEPVTAVFRLNDGRDVEIRSWTVDDEHWSAFRIRLRPEDETADASGEPDAPAGEPDAAADAPADAAAGDEAETAAKAERGEEPDADGSSAAGPVVEPGEGGDPEADAPTGPAAENETPPRADAADVEAQNARLSRWVYQLPDWKQEQLTRRTEDLLEPLEDEQPAAEE